MTATKTTYRQLADEGRRIYRVEPNSGRVIDHAVANLVGWACIDLSEIVATAATGEPVYVARCGEAHTRIVIR